jgi:hypothetical protein
MTINFSELEKNATRFFELKRYKELESELRNVAIRIIDQISSPEFAFPIKKEAVISSGITTYVYIDNLTYPNLLEFIAEILHTKIPVTINSAKFGPGEIMVNVGNDQEAQQELTSCVKELQKLIHAKKVRYLQNTS